MGTKKTRRGQDMISIPWYNHTGANVATNAVVRLWAGIGFGIAVADIASAATGEVEVQGCFKVAKNTGVAYTVGQRLGWDDTNSYVTTDLSAGIIGTVRTAAGSSDTEVEIYLNVNQPREHTAVHLCTSDDGTNNYVDFVLPTGFDVGTLAAPKCMIMASVIGTTGIIRFSPTALVLKQGSDDETIRVQDAGLATGEIVQLWVKEVVGR